MYGKNRETTSPINGAKVDNCGSLCFWLGFWLWFLGLLIAAIVGKAEGVMRAVKGFLCSLLIVVGLYVMLAVVFLILGKTSSDNDFYQTRLKLIAIGVGRWTSDNKQVPKSLERIRDSTYEYYNKKTEKTERLSYFDRDDLIDPWNNPIKMKVDSEKAGSHYSVKIVIRSAGPDGKFKTDDDLLAEESCVFSHLRSS